MGKRQRNAYDGAFKLKVIDFAEKNNNSAAEREFGVSEKQVRDWRKKKSVIGDSARHLKKIRVMESPYANWEFSLNEWVLEQRQNGHAVTRNMIRLKALSTAKDNGDEYFKALARWCTRFMRRHGLSIRQRTHIAQKLPVDVEEKVESFLKFVINERKRNDFDLAHIGNMDETPMFFDMPGNSTVHPVGDKTVTIRTSGNEKQHFTVVLSCLANGTKLKPLLVFKRKTMPKEKMPSGVVVTVNPKGWVDEAICLVWIEKVWNARPGALLKHKALLVWDMFRAHLMQSVKQKLRRHRTYQAVIPGGTTSVLQPLDVCLNKPFKANMRKQWHKWIVDGPKEKTKAGNLKRPGIELLTQWVCNAWEEIPNEMVVKSFKKCGISNAMDGTEDDKLFSDLICDKTNTKAPADDSKDKESESEDESESDDVYDDGTTLEEFRTLFGYFDDEDEFLGFEPEDL
jgi:hypothetical protein